jgi:hypothetical protein
MRRLRNGLWSVPSALEQPVTLENYGETIELDPCVSVSSYHAGDTTADVTERAEALLAPAELPSKKPLEIQA